MIINKIRLQEESPMTGLTDNWPLPVCDLNLNSTSGRNGYILKQVEGLDAPEMKEVVEGFDPAGIPSFLDVPEKRVLVFKIGLNPALSQSHGELRDALYKLMSRTVLVKLMYDSIVLGQTVGYISMFESELFTTKPEVQMTIKCKTGQFSGPKALSIPTSAGQLDTTNPIIDYQEGNAPTGLDLVLNVVSSASGFSITNYGRVRSLSTALNNNKFEVTYPLISGDQISMSTHPYQRRLTLLRSGVTTDLAGYINAGAVWPLLYPGVNTFVWTLVSSWLDWTTSTAKYTPKFWGV